MDTAYRILADTQDRLNDERLRSKGTWRNTGTTFYQGGHNGRNETIPEGAKIVVGTDHKVHTVKCNKCQEWGHYASHFPEVSYCHNLQSAEKGCFRNAKYLLDSGTTPSSSKPQFLVQCLDGLSALHTEESQ